MPNQPKPVTDSVEFLFEKVLVESAKFSLKADREKAWRMALAIIDAPGWDTQPSRVRMLKLWLEARKNTAEEAKLAAKAAAEAAEQAAQKAARQERIGLAIAAVDEAWSEAKETYRLWVVAEKVKGHQGQLAADQAFFKDFLNLSNRVDEVHRGKTESADDLLLDLAKATEYVRNFVQNWCQEQLCGTPIPDFISPEGGKTFRPRFCRLHVPAKKAADIWSVPPKHKVVKPGSAAKRHTEAKATNKARLTPNDVVVNERIVDRTAKGGRQPERRQPNNEAKGGASKRKQTKGLGS